MSKKKIMIIAPTGLSIIKFRASLIQTLTKSNYDVIVVIGFSKGNEIEQIKSIATEVISYQIKNNRVNIFKDIKAILKIKNTINSFKPNIIISYTIKPVIYTGLLIRNSKDIKFIPLITGLGFVFYGNSFIKFFLRNIVLILYRFSLRNVKHIIFQNNDNLKFFKKKNIAFLSKKHIINGSGVDSDLFNYSKPPNTSIKFIMVSRLLYEKGVIEYLKAASIVKIKYPKAKFILAGEFDNSYDTIKKKLLDTYTNANLVEYIGYTNDVKKLLLDSHIFVLPSYHEGLPRAVLEAMSIGRPIITTDAPGCKETVVNGDNGFLIKIKDYDRLAEQMIWFINNTNHIENMGLRSRLMVEKKFSNKIINNHFLKVLNEYE